MVWLYMYIHTQKRQGSGILTTHPFSSTRMKKTQVRLLYSGIPNMKRRKPIFWVLILFHFLLLFCIFFITQFEKKLKKKGEKFHLWVLLCTFLNERTEHHCCLYFYLFCPLYDNCIIFTWFSFWQTKSSKKQAAIW